MSAESVNTIFAEWLDEPKTKVGLQRCADALAYAFDHEMSVRVPRSAELRAGQFAGWFAQMRQKLAPKLSEAFNHEFPGIGARLGPKTLEDILTENVWPLAQDHFLTYAIEGIVTPWVRSHLGDALQVGQPARSGNRWNVPLSLSRSSPIGLVVLDLDGNVIESESDTREKLLAAMSG
jgi:hypothetical protein